MLRKFGIFYLLILSFSLHAQTIEDCVQQASFYGVDYSAPRIESSCKDLIINNANQEAIDYSSDNYIQAFGYKNMIHVLFHTPDDSGNPILTLSGLTAGKFTGLTSVRAIDIDEEKKMIYALNENADGSMAVLSVQADRDGALAARAKLYTNEIDGAQNIKTDRNQNELYVFGKDWIKVFNIDAHYKSSIPEQSIDVKRALKGNNTALYDIKDIAVSDEYLFVLDSEKINVYPRIMTDSDTSPIKSWSLAGSENTPINIEFNTDRLILTNSDQSTSEIILN